MCGRYTVTKAQEVLGMFFGAEFSERHVPIYNASPGQRLPVILDRDARQIRPALWGITPSWPGRRSRLLINARSEGIERSRTFREAFRGRRCLVVADGFYEWRSTGDGKQPYRIVARDGRPFAFAGLWEEIQGQPAYVVLTTSANAVMRPIHGRMPVILAPGQWEAWLDKNLGTSGLAPPTDAASEAGLSVYRVSVAVNSPRNQGPELILPADDPTEPTLFPT
jgi:putative SOS response-associated peptidase YedK